MEIFDWDTEQNEKNKINENKDFYHNLVTKDKCFHKKIKFTLLRIVV